MIAIRHPDDWIENSEFYYDTKVKIETVEYIGRQPEINECSNGDFYAQLDPDKIHIYIEFRFENGYVLPRIIPLEDTGEFISILGATHTNIFNNITDRDSPARYYPVKFSEDIHNLEQLIGKELELSMHVAVVDYISLEGNSGNIHFNERNYKDSDINN